LDSRVPVVGGSGRLPYRSAYADRGMQAYLKMCDSLSKRYLKNRRPFVPDVRSSAR
jgi:hypothetical protein